MFVWVGWNVLAPGTWRFDPYPFIFLTLILSLQASYAAPLILLAQNRQADRDRFALEQDRSRDERNLADTEFLTREVAALRIALRDPGDARLRARRAARPARRDGGARAWSSHPGPGARGGHGSLPPPPPT